MSPLYLFLYTFLSVGMRPSYIEHGNQNRPEIALTYDADMTPSMLSKLQSGQVKSWYNQKIIDTLISKKVPATIFLTGMWAESYPDISKSIANNSLFEIANHSYSHPAFTSTCFGLSPAANKEDEFSKSQQTITQITGVRPTLFRFPGGCKAESDIKLANKYGLTVVGWNDASGDSFNTDRQSIINQIKKNTHNGSIIVFHLHGNRNAPLSGDVLPEVIDYLRNKHFKFVKVSDLIAKL